MHDWCNIFSSRAVLIITTTIRNWHQPINYYYYYYYFW